MKDQFYQYQMKCPNCNNTIRKDAYDCVYCGYELGFEGGGLDEIDNMGMSDRIIYFCVGAAIGCAVTCVFALIALL